MFTKDLLGGSLYATLVSITSFLTHLFFYFYLFIFKNIYLFFWLLQVLVADVQSSTAACRIFSWSCELKEFETKDQTRVLCFGSTAS